VSAITGTSNPVEVRAPVEGRDAEILTPEALAFVAVLQREFGGDRAHLLAAREQRQAELDAGALPDFLTETQDLRDADWQVAPAPADLQDRRVEITGPVDRKMVLRHFSARPLKMRSYCDTH
jgi:malate synthase